jgi:hypothetical protein
VPREKAGVRAAARSLLEKPKADRGVWPFATGECAMARMIWLIVLISIDGGRPQVVEKIPFKDMQSCQAEKAVRDSRRYYFAFAHDISVKRNVVCSEDPAAHVG